MHEASSRTAPRARPIFPSLSDRTLWRRNLARWGALAGLAALVLAWVDGGEEPIHPIIESVAAPAGGGA